MITSKENPYYEKKIYNKIKNFLDLRIILSKIWYK